MLQGRQLLVVHTHSADNIDALLRLQAEFKFHMTIVGGGEAHLLAAKLAEANVSIILAPVTYDQEISLFFILLFLLV